MAALVPLADQMRAATTAADHPPEAKIVFVTGGQWPIAPEHGLGTVKQHLGNQWLVHALEGLAEAGARVFHQKEAPNPRQRASTSVPYASCEWPAVACSFAGRANP